MAALREFYDVLKYTGEWNGKQLGLNTVILHFNSYFRTTKCINKMP
jgi:hypothetical protein